MLNNSICLKKLIIILNRLENNNGFIKIYKGNELSTYTQILFQIVISTKNRERTLKVEKRVELHKFIWGILKNKNCHLYQIGGIEDHIHIVTHIHPSIDLSAIIKDIKVASNEYIKKRKLIYKF